MEETVELYYAWKKAADAIAEAKQMIFEEKDEKYRGGMINLPRCFYIFI